MALNSCNDNHYLLSTISANVNIDSICDDILMTDVPPWKLVNPIVNFSLTAFKKDNTSGTVYKQLYLEQCSKYDGFEKNLYGWFSKG